MARVKNSPMSRWGRPFRHHDGRPGCRHLRRRGRALLPDESEVEEEKNRSRRGIGVAR